MIFENRLVLSAMAGINNADFCLRQKAALVIMGGFNADDKAIKAAKKVVARGRREFIFDEPIDGIENEIKRIYNKKKFAVNVRSASIDGYVEVAKIVKKYNGIVEINAHCRQPEFVDIGCGQYLLFNQEKLIEIVKEVSKICTTAVKIRGSLEIDYLELAKQLRKVGCKIIHVDAMIPDGLCDLKLIGRISKTGFTIGNNSFIDVQSGEAMIKAGAKMASAARAVLKNPKFFDEMLKSKILSERVELGELALLNKN